MKRIKFVSYHGCQDEDKRRNNSPAADNKIDYIIEVLNRCGYAVDHISKASSTIDKFIPGYVEHANGNTYRFFSSFGKKYNPILRLLTRWFMEIQFFWWCMLNIKRGEQVLVYHSLGYDSAFIKLKKLKGIKIIGEIEEIYQDVTKKSQSTCRNEYKFINNCDKFIFPTQLLDERLNVNKKPSVIIHGLYSVEKRRNVAFGDDKIHVIYAGTFDPNKGGGAAAAAAAYLPNNYHVHICGFGNRKEEETIKEIIEETTKHCKAKVTFDGLLKGEDFIQMLQKCTIGLSTQDPNAAFNATSFPSKILTYLSNGLKVVSIRIPAIEKSYVGSMLTFYDDQTPENIATAIISATNKVGESPERLLSMLDEKFGRDIVYLLK